MENGPEQNKGYALSDSIIINTSPIPISIAKAVDGRFIVVNAAWVELFGRQREDVLGRTSLEVGYWPSAEDRRRWFEALQRQGGLYGYETVLCTMRGEHRNILLSSSFIEFAGENCIISFIQDITERKQMEETLRENAARLGTVLDATADGILAVDANGKVVLYNRQFARLWHIPQDILDTSDDGIVLDHVLVQLSDPDAFLDEVRRLYGSIESSIDTIHFKDGRIFERFSLPMRKEESLTPGRVWSFRDITERRQAENRLKETRDMMLAAVSAGQVYPWVWDLATDSLHWGVSPVQLLGPIPDGKDSYLDFRDLVHPDDRATFLAVGRHALDKGSQYYHEFRVVMTDGPVRWVAARGELMRDEAGQVVRMLGTTMDITKRRHAEERIHELAFFDQLTGLPNRTLLLDRMKQAMTASVRNGGHAALLYIDLDNFKTLNDTFGHDMGDLLLKQVAQRLTNCVRAGDTVARLGGDEFIVILTSLSTLMNEAASQTETVGQKILVALNQIYQLKEVAYHSTPSIGATLFTGQQTDVDDLLKQADFAMYQSKEAGRNTLRFFDPDMELS